MPDDIPTADATRALTDDSFPGFAPVELAVADLTAQLKAAHPSQSCVEHQIKREVYENGTRSIPHCCELMMGHVGRVVELFKAKGYAHDLWWCCDGEGHRLRVVIWIRWNKKR